MLEQLAAAGKGGMVVWPVHCVTGTWGHNIHSDVARSLAAWEMTHQRAVAKALKGEYPLTEHFGVFEADAPVPSVPGTQFNTALATSLAEGADVVAIAGQASSHCVAASYDQFTRFLARTPGLAPRVVLLQDCMSPVPGFEKLADALFERARAAGTGVMTADEFAQSIS
jgi:nicotinamidase/pyrazinamidase